MFYQNKKQETTEIGCISSTLTVHKLGAVERASQLFNNTGAAATPHSHASTKRRPPTRTAPNGNWIGAIPPEGILVLSTSPLLLNSGVVAPQADDGERPKSVPPVATRITWLVCKGWTVQLHLIMSAPALSSLIRTGFGYRPSGVALR
ncbi:hypothetical protein AAG570_003891 [Ranatra chinensis]|uniref:Uncharacterized protein n=1 Tax=Ranatra chinensis TaxID=642074 RepID=A0ABD0Y2A5_9HEMI